MHLPSGEPEPAAVRRARGRVASDFAAAQDRTNPRHQFPHADGPIEIVVGTEFQRNDAVHLVALLMGGNDDWSIRNRADIPEETQAILLRRCVEQDEVRLDVRHGAQDTLLYADAA